MSIHTAPVQLTAQRTINTDALIWFPVMFPRSFSYLIYNTRVIDFFMGSCRVLLSPLLLMAMVIITCLLKESHVLEVGPWSRLLVVTCFWVDVEVSFDGRLTNCCFVLFFSVVAIIYACSDCKKPPGDKTPIYKCRLRAFVYRIRSREWHWPERLDSSAVFGRTMRKF